MVRRHTPDLPSLLPQIAAIRDAFKAPSVSVGVLHGGGMWTHSEGFADIERAIRADADTIYAIASCTKAFTTATVARLVEEGKLDWHAPVASYLPAFASTPADPEVGRRASLRDMCSHGTGLAPVDHAMMGFFDEWYMTGPQSVSAAAHLPVAYDFRSRFLYNNAAYGVVGEVIAHAAGMSTGSAIKEHIFSPLGLSRTFTKTSDYPDDNAAKGYTILDDGTPLCRGYPSLSDADPQGAAGFVRSSVNDMLKWAGAVMDDEDGGGLLLPGIGYTRAAHRPITDDNGLGENSYGMGWFRHTLPSRMLSSIGPNYRLFGDDPPVINAGGRPRLAIAHYGEFQGFLAAFYTLPETKSAVVVLANSSMSRGDPTDLIAQSIIQELFDMTPRVDLVAYAHKAAARARNDWPDLVREWQLARLSTPAAAPSSDYVGTYENAGLGLRIDVLGDLFFRVNNMPSQTARLRHYHYDVWTWLPESRDAAVRAGAEFYLSLPLMLLSFVRDNNKIVVALDWDLQANTCEGPAPNLNVKPIRLLRATTTTTTTTTTNTATAACQSP